MASIKHWLGNPHIVSQPNLHQRLELVWETPLKGGFPAESQPSQKTQAQPVARYRLNPSPPNQEPIHQNQNP
jgi:hypothetical protein